MYELLFSFFSANQNLFLLAIAILTAIYLIYNISQSYKVKIDFKKFIYDSPNLKINTSPSSSSPSSPSPNVVYVPTIVNDFIKNNSPKK